MARIFSSLHAIVAVMGPLFLAPSWPVQAQLSGLGVLTAGNALSAPASARQQKTPSVLPMQAGYYAEVPQTCAAAVSNLSGMLVGSDGFSYMDVFIAVTRIVRGTTGEYTLTERAEGQGETNTYTSKVRLINSTDFVRTHPDFHNPKGPPIQVAYRFCSASAPKDFE